MLGAKALTKGDSGHSSTWLLCYMKQAVDTIIPMEEKHKKNVQKISGT